MKNDHLWSFFNIIYSFLGSIVDPCYIQNRVIMNRVIKRLWCIYYHVYDDQLSFSQNWGWLGVAKVLCILCHWGFQLILAYSWARPAILVAGKGRGGMFYFFCFFTFIPVPLSSLSLSFISCTISSISFLPFSGRQHKMTHKGWRVVKPQHNQCSQNYFTHLYSVIFELHMTKPTKWMCAQQKTDQSWHPQSLISLCCVLNG